MDEKIEKRFEKVKHSRTFRRLLKEHKLSETRVLDIGCGYGEYLSLFGKGSFGLTTIEREVKYASTKGLSVQIHNGELLHELSIPEPFEVVWANNFFEHILSPHAFLVHLRRIVTPRGKLILGVPVIPKIAFLLRFRKFHGALATSHINFFTQESLELTVARAGWTIEESRSYVLPKFFDILVSLFSPHIYCGHKISLFSV